MSFLDVCEYLCAFGILKRKLKVMRIMSECVIKVEMVFFEQKKLFFNKRFYVPA